MTKRKDQQAPADTAQAPAPANNVSVAMFARATGVNPKTIRAKLRRIAKKTDSAIKHTHKEHWLFTPEIAKAFNVDYAKAVAGVTKYFAKQAKAS